MKILSLTVILSAASLLVGGAQDRKPAAPVDILRGRYLVESVAMCGQCHTPRDSKGELIRSQWLKGATVPVSNPSPNNPWAEFAPRIAGLPQYTNEQALTLLTRGIARTGKPLRAPMPPFHFSDTDARDIIAYLRSLE